MTMDHLYKLIVRVRPFCHDCVVLRRLSLSAIRVRGLASQRRHSALATSSIPREKSSALPKIYFDVKDHPFNQEENEESGRENGEDSHQWTFGQRQYYARQRFARKQEPVAPVLVTWEARHQIKYLFQHDPIRWSPQILAQSFPISVKDAERLVHGNSQFKGNPQYIKRHDKAVQERWKALKSGRGGHIVTPEQRQLFKEGKLKEIQSTLNGSFPIPEAPPAPFQLPPPPPGPFTNLIKSYISAQEENANAVAGRPHTASTSPAHLPTLHSALQTTTDYHVLDKPYVEANSRVAGVEIVVMNNEKDQPDSRARISAWTAPRSPAVRQPVMHDQVKKRIINRVAQQDQRLGDAYSKWFERFDVENLKSSDKVAFKEQQKGNSQVNLEEAAIIKEKYAVKPWEKREKMAGDSLKHEENISIPMDVRRENTIYRKGNSFYDCNGQFLYRVPLIN